MGVSRVDPASARSYNRRLVSMRKVQMIMRRKNLQIVSLLATAVWLFGGAARAADEGPNPSLNLEKIRRDVAAAAISAPSSAVTGISVVDVASGQEIFGANADRPLNPASNTKIVTAAGALKLLGPEFRFRTSLHGKKDGAVIRGPLYFVGHGDPSLESRHLWEMASRLVAAGVRRVEGGIVVDDSYFDSENLPYAFDDQPNEDASFRAPVGAVSLNHNALAITIRPGAAPLSPARVVFDPPNYALVVNDAVTLAKGAHNPKISATPYENRTRIRVWGQIPLRASSVTYFRRIDNPSLFSGYGLKGILEGAGISVGGDVQTGPMPPGTPALVDHASEPLSSVLWETGKMSNNFVTEMVLKTIGAELVPGPGTWAGALEQTQKVLAEWGLEPGSYVYRNGSGLFDANRFSARQLTRVLEGAYKDAAIRPELLTQLAIGGVDGTIRSRFSGNTTRRLVRAKTGTLADVSALSGYVLDETGRSAIAFSIIVNDAQGYISASRALQERIVTAIADVVNSK